MVTYGRHPFIRLVSTYKDKVIDHIKFQHWRTFINYDPTHPYQVKCLNMLTNTVSSFGPNIITICYIDLCMKRETKVNSNFFIEKFKKYLIRLPTFYLIIWTMKQPNNFEKVAILKI